MQINPLPECSNPWTYTGTDSNPPTTSHLTKSNEWVMYIYMHKYIYLWREAGVICDSFTFGVLHQFLPRLRIRVFFLTVETGSNFFLEDRIRINSTLFWFIPESNSILLALSKEKSEGLSNQNKVGSGLFIESRTQTQVFLDVRIQISSTRIRNPDNTYNNNIFIIPYSRSLLVYSEPECSGFL